MAVPLILVAAAAAVAAVALTSGGGSGSGDGPRTIPPPKRVGRRLNAYTPATLRATAGPGAAPPERAIAPDGLTWREYSGTINIGSIRKPNRDVGPGIDTIDLAEVYGGDGPVRVFADVYVADWNPATGKSTAAIVANTAFIHNNVPPLDATQVTEQAERIVRDFGTSNDGLVEGEQTSALIEHNERNPPRLLSFYGNDCHIGHITANDGLYHLADCRGTSTELLGKPEFAYPYEYEVIDGVVRTKLNRTYNLSLEARADGKVYLTARIMRLPARQNLAWRAYVASQPL